MENTPTGQLIRIEELYQLAQRAFEQGDRDQAIEQLGELLELSKAQLSNPGGTDLNELLHWMNQTGLLCNDNNCPEAAFAFYGLVEAVPLDGQTNPKRKRTARCGLSESWDKVGEERLAIDHLKSLIAEDDGSLEFGVYRAVLAHYYRDFGQPRKAIPLLEQAVKTAREEGHGEFYQQWLVILDQIKESLTWRDRLGVVTLSKLFPENLPLGKGSYLIIAAAASVLTLLLFVWAYSRTAPADTATMRQQPGQPTAQTPQVLSSGGLACTPQGAIANAVTAPGGGNLPLREQQEALNNLFEGQFEPAALSEPLSGKTVTAGSTERVIVFWGSLSRELSGMPLPDGVTVQPLNSETTARDGIFVARIPGWKSLMFGFVPEGGRALNVCP